MPQLHDPEKKINDTTDFGFETIPTSEKTQKVLNVFHSVADKYDVMNDVMSLGVHRLWKRLAIQYTAPRVGENFLDLAGGSGDITILLAKKIGEKGSVVLADINASMLKTGRTKCENKGFIGNIRYAQSNAEQLPFPDNTFSGITIAFGLRNVTDKSKALREMARVLQPGGRLIVLEFSKPIIPLLEKCYDVYSFQLLPWLGKTIANDEASYRYLAESIRRHPDQITLNNMILNAGFDHCEYHNMSGGIVALHKATVY